MTSDQHQLGGSKNRRNVDCGQEHVNEVVRMGAFLRDQRRSWGLTQAGLAKRVGLKQKKISRIENGEIDDPGFFDIARIAQWFGIRMEHIARMGGLS